jgi:hypothetical protein
MCMPTLSAKACWMSPRSLRRAARCCGNPPRSAPMHPAESRQGRGYEEHGLRTLQLERSIHGRTQKLIRKANWNTRWSMPSRPLPVVAVITLNPPRLLTVPLAFKIRLATLEPGLAKCGVLVTLKA